MSMIIRTTTALASIFLALLLSGCGSGGKAKYIEPTGTDTIVTINDINIQDFIMAAERLTQSMLNSGVLDQARTQPATLGISRVVNNTQQHFDTDELIKKIRVDLLKSGKVRVATGIGANPEDPLAQQENQRKDFIEGNSTPAPILDFTLTAKILERRAQAGKTQQNTFIFQMTLTDPNQARPVSVWEEEEMITKQGRKPSVGW